MASLADFILTHIPLPSVPNYLTSYIPGETPLSTWTSVCTALVSYLAVIFGTRQIMKSYPPQKLNALFRAHNAGLSVGSLILLVLMMEEVVPIIWSRGIFRAMCAPPSWTPRLEFYYMINYYFKYLELFDTVFLAFKKKPLAFLHVFHHSATAMLCFTQLNGKTSVSWVVISLNLLVHVIMYYYYYATAGGAKIWWKKYLTSMQIIQFVIDLFVVYFGTYSHFVYAYYPNLPVLGECAGAESSAIIGCALLTSYLGLFINFYIQTYKAPIKSGKKPINGVANGNGKVE